MVRKAIANVRRSGARYLLTTHFVTKDANLDIEIGGYRPVNLCAPPFFLPEPLELVNDFDGVNRNRKHMALWRCKDL